MAHEPRTIAYGQWDRPNCVYCGDPIEATFLPLNAPQFIPTLKAWAHAACWHRDGAGRREVEQAAMITLVETEELR